MQSGKVQEMSMYSMNENIKEFLKLIDEYQSPINKEIKDNKKAEEVWALMSDLESKLEELKI